MAWGDEMKLNRVKVQAKFAKAIYEPEEFAALTEEFKMQHAVINVDNHRAGVAWDDRKIFIAFCGTNDIKDVRTDLDADQEELPAWPVKGATMHSGVLEAVRALKEPLHTAVSRAKGTLGNHIGGKNQLIYLTGHSLGGMIAAAFSAGLGAQLNIREVITFGAARVGNKAFCKSVHVPTIRVVNSLDVVPMMPLKLMSIIFGRSRHHEDTLVYITGDGEITMEPPSIWQTGEDIIRAIVKDACDKDFIPAMLQYHFMDSYLEALGV